jgi:hypothetical protein
MISHSRIMEKLSPTAVFTSNLISRTQGHEIIAALNTI